MTSRRLALSPRRTRLLAGGKSVTSAARVEPTNASQDPRAAMVLQALLLILLIIFPALGRDVFSNPVEHPERFDVYGAVAAYIRPLSGAAPLLYVTLRYGTHAVPQAAPRVLVPFLIWAAASTLWSATSKQTVQDSFELVFLCLSTAVTVQRAGVVRVARTMLWVISAVVVASALLAVLVPSIGVHNSTSAIAAVHAGRWKGIFSHKNGLGPWAAYGTVLVVAHRSLLRVRPLVLWVIAACGAACLVFSGSSSSIAIAPVLIAAGWLVSLRRRLSTTGFVLLLAVALTLFSGTALLLQAATLQLLGRDPTLTGRTELWSLAGRLIAEHPMTGSGFMTQGGEEYKAAVERLYSQTLTAENVYLQVLLELGFVGAVLIFGAVAVAVVSGLRRGAAALGDEEQAWRMMLTLTVTTLVLGVTNADILTPVGPSGSLSLVAISALLTPALILGPRARRPTS